MLCQSRYLFVNMMTTRSGLKPLSNVERLSLPRVECDDNIFRKKL